MISTNKISTRLIYTTLLASFYNKQPKEIIGVTGTNGKTSVANFYNQILSLNNKKVASIGTLGVLSKKLRLNKHNTTLDPVSVHKILHKLKKLLSKIIKY